MRPEAGEWKLAWRLSLVASFYLFLWYFVFYVRPTFQKGAGKISLETQESATNISAIWRLKIYC